MAMKKSTGKRRRRRPSVAIGTWPTPERPGFRKKVSKKKRSPRAIDTVPLPEKPRARKKAVKKKTKRTPFRKKR